MSATGTAAARRCAFEQYNEGDPRNRLVAAKLEAAERPKTEMLIFTVPDWGGTHTRFRMGKLVSGSGQVKADGTTISP